MRKKKLLDLLDRMLIFEEGMISNQTTSWKAHREADKLSKRKLLPILYEIVDENEGEDKQKQFLRSRCYYIIGQITIKKFKHEDCEYIFNRLKKEYKNNDVVYSLFEVICNWRNDANIFVPDDIDITPLVEIVTNKRGWIKRCAIQTLGCCPRKESRDVIRTILTQEDEKKHKEEIRWANVALQHIGEHDDIPYLERFLKSRIPNSKITAQYAIQYIKERNNL
ncbi:MAG: hypothetical protein K2I75_05695 [Clostridiales bacterium]|nr:hypothetical protein [Clostridiales bacterium]